MAASSDSDDETFVVLGKPLPFKEGDGRKKTLVLQDASAKVGRERPRFHGAFTGGFSAGYFNSVGSKEGWTPSTFVSSRSKKQQLSDQRPEDFMDNEDFEEYGIAPRRLVTSDAFTSEERNRKRLSEVVSGTMDNIIPVTPALADLIVPERLPIGIKLLRKMGWKEGQGIGPRLKSNKLKKQRMPVEPGVKTYGCALPPIQDDSENEASDEDLALQNVTFAPKDVAPIKITSKDNVHGLGYHGLDPRVALPSTHINLFDPPPVQSSKSRKGIRGQAFGVGALEEEDEDIYAADSVGNYDQTMEINDDQQFGWTAPGLGKNREEPNRSVNFVGKLLDGFTVSAKPLPQKKVFPAPSLPNTFRPFHKFRKTVEQLVQEAIGETPLSGSATRQNQKLTALDRGLLLGETPIASSVFDLIPKADIRRMEAVKEAAMMAAVRFPSTGKQLEENCEQKRESSSGIVMSELVGAGQGLPQSAVLSTECATGTAAPTLALCVSQHHADPQGPVTGERKGQLPMFQGSLSFQPFRKDPVKQSRYDQYMALVKQGVKDPYEQIVGSSLTEWERQREREEFAKAAMIYRPLSNMMASRFTRGAFIDDAEKISRPTVKEGEQSERVKAAEMKMYGQLTREELEWHPHNLLCKRFNVPNPYPGSEIVGLLAVKRDKLSVFNFLNFPVQGDSPQMVRQRENTKPKEASSSPKGHCKQKVGAGPMSVFSVLEDSALSMSSSRKQEEAEVNIASDKDPEENKEPAESMDLFRAIFKNSDSESSSDEKSDEERDDNNKKHEEENKHSPEHPSTSVQLLGSDAVESGSLHGTPEAVQTTEALVLDRSPSPTLPVRKGSNLHRLGYTRWGGSIFDAIDDSTETSMPCAVHQQDARRDSLEQNLGPDLPPSAEDDCYGPALPPPRTQGGSSPSNGTNINTSCESHHKQKHKNKYRDESWLERKSRKKKSKHKKKKKRKEKKEKEEKHSKRRQSQNLDTSVGSQGGPGSQSDTSQGGPGSQSNATSSLVTGML